METMTCLLYIDTIRYSLFVNKVQSGQTSQLYIILKYKLVEGSDGYPKKKGAASSVGTINTRNPIHHAPTQRGSFCSNVILQRKRTTDLQRIVTSP